MSSVMEERPQVEIPDPYSLPLDQLDPAQVSIFQNDALWGYFERLRN